MDVHHAQKDTDSKLGCSEWPQLEVQQTPEYADWPARTWEESASSLAISYLASAHYPEQGSNTPSKNTGRESSGDSSGAPCGALPDDSDRYAHFCELLAEAGFSEVQRALINDAMKAAGLTIVDSDE